MPTLEEVVEKFETWWVSGNRVQVNWAGLAAVPADQKLMTAQVDGRVITVGLPEGGRTEVMVGQMGGNNSSISMRLSAQCIFQTMTKPPEEVFPNLESLIRIAFPTGEHCFVHFFNPPH